MKEKVWMTDDEAKLQTEFYAAIHGGMTYDEASDAISECKFTSEEIRTLKEGQAYYERTREKPPGFTKEDIISVKVICESVDAERELMEKKLYEIDEENYTIVEIVDLTDIRRAIDDKTDAWIKRNQELDRSMMLEGPDAFDSNMQKYANMTNINLDDDLTVSEKTFLKDCFGVDDLHALSDDAYMELYDKLCDIEVNETYKTIEVGYKSDGLGCVTGSKPMSIFGVMASDLVTFMGNQFIEGGRRYSPK